jgi:hypothetical protein
MLMNLRHLAERFSRGVILRRHLPKQFQSLPLYVSPEAGLRYWRWGVETADPMLFRMVRELVRPGSVVWDVGANVGLFSFSAAALAGPGGFVLAIEPDVWLAHLLARSAQRIQQHSAGAAPGGGALCRRIRGQPHPPTPDRGESARRQLSAERSEVRVVQFLPHSP